MYIDPYNNRKLLLQIDISRNSAKYLVRDEGKGFAHSDLLDPKDPENLPRIKGRGLLLIMNFMDEVISNERANEMTKVSNRKRN